MAQSAAVRLFGASAAQWLVPVLNPYLGQLGRLLLLGLVAAGIGLVPPYLSKLLIDQGLMAANSQALIFWAGMLFAVGLTAVALGALNNILHMRASVRMLADLRGQLMQALIAKPQGWFAGHRAGELLARVDGDAGEVQKFAFNAVLGGTSSLVRLVGGTTMLMVLNWKLGLIAALLAPIELVFLAWARPHTTRLAGRVRGARGQFTAGLSEALHGLPALQVAGGTDWAQARSSGDQDALNDQLLVQQRWLEFTRAVPQILSASMRACIFVAGGIMVIRGDWPLGSLIAFVAYVGFMIGPMQSLLGLWHAQARAKVALQRLDGLLQGAPGADAVDGPDPADGGLRLDAVQLQRNGAMIGPVTCDIPQGCKLALTGPSGTGKTSLLMALSGWGAVTGGQIRLGGVPLDALSLSQLRARVAFVSQRPFVARGSLRDNLFLPTTMQDNPDTDARIWTLLDELGLAERFRSAGGLDAMLGENGLTLSGGERQRLCLLRALMRGFDILILDEALSEVDADRVARIIAFIDRGYGQSTRIITTHSATDAYGAFDQVLDLSERPA
ncbi:MAG: ABC transporter ATP-binding protein/permease [Marinibacterium sp.]|nr:ABC transporter ATP-binding protein/permease [Marinibacterium sp.]